MRQPLPRLIVAAGITVLSTRAEAQVDYRNLDGHRPSRVEDAFPIERYGFDFSLSSRGGGTPGYPVELEPELAWGAFRNGMLGLSLSWRPFRTDGARAVEPRISSGFFAVANLVGETASLPAVGVRAEVTRPLDRGGLGAEALTLTALATRSWRLTRVHLNAAWTVAAPDDAALAPEAKWWAGLAVDRTLFRSSTLVVGEIVAARERGADRVDWTVGLGGRRQLTPTWVLDLGGSWTGADGGRFALTAGWSHAFAIAGLMPGRRR
jgi:hypothetical protein